MYLQEKNKLDKEKKYYDVSTLNAGDILLTSYYPSTSSRKIQLLTGGKYTHSIIVIHPLLFFESTTVGSGFVRPFISKVEQNIDGEKKLWDISSFKEFDVYRHKSINNESKIAERLIDILGSQRGKEYPSLSTLRNASKVSKAVPFVSYTILKIADLFTNKKIIPGMFCSEVVSFCITQLGYDPFTIKFKHNEVNPNHFSDKSISNFRKVTNISFADDFKEDYKSYRDLLNGEIKGEADELDAIKNEVKLNRLIVEYNVRSKNKLKKVNKLYNRYQSYLEKKSLVSSFPRETRIEKIIRFLERKIFSVKNIKRFKRKKK